MVIVIPSIFLSQGCYYCNMKLLIETKRLIIREIQECDIDFLWEIYKNPTNVKFIPVGQIPNSKEVLRNKYSEINKNSCVSQSIYSVILKAEDKIIGEAGYFNSFNEAEHLELGYIIDCEYWNMGLGTELCQSLVDYGFKNMHTNRLTARMYGDNLGSKRVSEKCGMNLNEETKNPFGAEVLEYTILNSNQ